MELQAHKASLDKLRKALRSKSFIALWGQRLALQGSRDWVFLNEAEAVLEADALVIHLNPHLRVLRDGFALPDAEASKGQLDLFSLPAIHDRTAATASFSARAQPRRRRTA
ncbi:MULTISPECIES: hypothetical protein [Methylobacterium]|uniref:hypothetical protein n=1 Tax=Methylobacterium TaxID=407 RepID=UPI001F3FBB25|nr:MULTISPECIES: hypothetical protein [Methylobacterium]MCF4124932.1 hypothetical protein [Methylobacterium sp. SyP6R]